MVGASPTSLPLWAIGAMAGPGGGPHIPPGGPPLGGPPLGYPPPGHPPLGYPPPGGLSCAIRIGRSSGSLLASPLGGSPWLGPVALWNAALSSTMLTVCGFISPVSSLTASVLVAIGGWMWIDSASSTSQSSLVVFPAAPVSSVPLVLLSASSSSPSLAVEGARVLGCAIGCLSMGPTCPAVCTSSSNISHQ